MVRLDHAIKSPYLWCSCFAPRTIWVFYLLELEFAIDDRSGRVYDLVWANIFFTFVMDRWEKGQVGSVINVSPYFVDTSLTKSVGLARITWTILIFVMVGIIGFGTWKQLQTSQRKLPIYGKLIDFEFTEHHGKPFGSRELNGKIWVADFIFTRCAGPCPKMSSAMGKLQQLLGEKPDIKLVSFSVDPEFDTPSVLADYARTFHASEDRWFFLTGRIDALRQLAKESFKLVFERTSGLSMDDPNAILHSSHFVLIDRHSCIRGYYDSADEKVFDRILDDIKVLLKEK